MAVSVSAGNERMTSQNFVGQTISQVRQITAVTQYLGLQGNEEVEVLRSGSTNWETVGGDYTLRDGDSVRFMRSAGTKG